VTFQIRPRELHLSSILRSFIYCIYYFEQRLQYITCIVCCCGTSHIEEKELVTLHLRNEWCWR